MGKATKLGIWMDHTTAHVMEFTTDPILTKTIQLTSSAEKKENSFGQNEIMVHHKEQRLLTDYYKKLTEIIRGYEEVLLFGPTDAKVELLNLLKDDHRFSNVKIIVTQSDKMTENQQHAFVRHHFSKHIIKA